MLCGHDLDARQAVGPFEGLHPKTSQHKVDRLIGALETNIRQSCQVLAVLWASGFGNGAAVVVGLDWFWKRMEKGKGRSIPIKFLFV